MLWRTTEDRGAVTGTRGWQPYLGRQANAVEALTHFRDLLQG